MKKITKDVLINAVSRGHIRITPENMIATGFKLSSENGSRVPGYHEWPGEFEWYFTRSGSLDEDVSSQDLQRCTSDDELRAFVETNFVAIANAIEQVVAELDERLQASSGKGSQ
jgi:hypothetical protein